jgi:hypothetical protein
MAQPSSSAKQEGQQAAADVKQATHDVADKAKEASATVLDKAKDVTSAVGHKASEMASAVGHKAEDATHAMGSGMQSLGSTLREHGPRSSVLGSATSAVAGSLESGGRYLEEQGLSGMGRDLTNLIRHNPITSLFVGIGIGYMLARITRG